MFLTKNAVNALSKRAGSSHQKNISCLALNNNSGADVRFFFFNFEKIVKKKMSETACRCVYSGLRRRTHQQPSAPEAALLTVSGGARKGNCAHAIEHPQMRPFWGAAPPHTVTSKDILRLFRKIPRD